MKKPRSRLLGYMLAAVTVFTFAFGCLTPKQEVVAETNFTEDAGDALTETSAEFTIKGLEGGDMTMSVDDIKNLKNRAGDSVGRAEATYTSKENGTEKVKGALLKNILAAQGLEVETAGITINTTDQYEQQEESYNGITLKNTIDQKYFVAYQVWNAEINDWEDISDQDSSGKQTFIRIYREYNEAQGNDPEYDWRNRCINIAGITVDVPEVTVFKENPTSGGVRSTAMDADGNLWVGTYGGGLYEKKGGAEGWDPIYKTTSDPALSTNVTSAVAVDADGGVWVSQNASYTDPNNNQGVLYIKDGKIVEHYRADDNPATIPNDYVQSIKVDKDGKVWFGSFGGVTIYDPEAKTWMTYSKESSGFPATSCNTIVLDGHGGAWLGFYPDGAGTEESPYSGGFCHMTADGTVDKKVIESGATPATFAQVWTRNIAIDLKGTVWVVAAGTNIDDNVGGVVWKWKSGSEEPTKYTGDQLFGDYLDGSTVTEVRVVAVDPEGNLWFGTSADGVLKVEDPKLNDDGSMTVAAQYAKETGSWSADNMNNVYSIDFYNGGTAYVGSSGGVQILGEEPAAPDENEDVIRVFGATRYETSLKVADELKDKLGKDKFDTIILADGRNYPDALAGSYLSCLMDAPILLVSSQQKNIDAAQVYIKANLNTGSTIYILGGTGAVPDTAVAGLDDYKVKRLGGQDRYETNLKILEEAGKKTQANGFMVCTGKAFADSLSVAGVGKPILLVKNTILDSQKKYLNSLTGDKTFDVIGGTGAVSEKIENELKAFGSTFRIDGKTRYETSVNVAVAFYGKTSTGVVAYGKNFPDGLCGGALAHAMGGPLILTENSKTEAAVKYAGQMGMYSGTVLGGQALISDKAAREIFHLDASADIDER